MYIDWHNNISYILSLTKTLEELKEMAIKHLTIQLEMMKEVPTMNFKDIMDFIKWYSEHPFRKELNEIMKNLTLSRNGSTNIAIQ